MPDNQHEDLRPTQLCGHCKYRRIISSGTHCLKYYSVRLWHGDCFPDYPRWTECEEPVGLQVEGKNWKSNINYFAEIYPG